ncbi:MAG: RnfABCDGE type electron transport complex subunit D [Oscillospiraceae bacterium]
MKENTLLAVSPSPHITAPVNTTRIMGLVCAALVPTAVASFFLFGWRAFAVIAVTVAACVLFEAICCRLLKKEQTIKDLSAVVTGLLLAFNLPATFPLWMAVVGAFIAIVVTKHMFGGLGRNFANPALVARIVLQLSFTEEMINYVFPVRQGAPDVLATATPLLAAKSGVASFVDLLLGTHAGMLGETCAITLMAGGIFLILTKVIKPTIPFVYLGTLFGLKFLLLLFGENSANIGNAFTMSAIYLLSGGAILAAFFMATDYTTSPYPFWGKVVYALVFAVLTVCMREWSNMSEGASFALLMANLLVPYLNSLFRPKPFGLEKTHIIKRGEGKL